MNTAPTDADLAAKARRRATALGGLAVAMLAWGVSGVVAKSIDMGGMALAAYRTTVGAGVLLAILTLSGRRLTWSAMRTGAPGGVFLGFDMLLFFEAVRHTTIANATVIGALQPALIVLLSAPLLGEVVTRGAATWALVGVFGTAVVVFGASGLPEWSLYGDLLAVGSLLAWTGYFVTSRVVRDRLGALEYATVSAIVASLVAWPAAALARQDLSWPDAGSWWWIVALAVISGVGGHFLMSVSIPHLPLSVSSTMTLSVPVVSTAVAAVVLDEQVTALQGLGMAVVLVGLGFSIRASATTPGRRPARR